MTTRQSIADLFDQSAERFDAIYSGAAGAPANAWDRLTRRNIHTRFDFTMQALAPAAGLRILDAGCGPGRYCIEFTRQGAETVGVDVAPRMLEIARDLAAKENFSTRCHFVQADLMEDGPWNEGGFDAVVAMGFFDYISDQEVVLRRLAQLGRGRVIASFPCRWSPRAPVRKVWWRLRGWRIVFSSRRDIDRLCARCGIEIRQLRRDGPVWLLETGAARAPAAADG